MMSISKNIIVFLIIAGAAALVAPGGPVAAQEQAELQAAVEQVHKAQEETRQEPGNVAAKRELLVRAIDTLVLHAEMLRERALRIPVADESLVASLRAELQDNIRALSDFRTRATSASSMPELRALATEVREYRDDAVQKNIRRLMLLSYADAFEHRVLATTFSRADRIAQTLDQFEQLGKNVTALETLLTEARASTAQASNDLQELKQTILAQERIERPFMEEARKSFQKMFQNVHETYQIFRQISLLAEEL